MTPQLQKASVAGTLGVETLIADQAKKLFAGPDLTIGDLAKMLNTSAFYLSAIISRQRAREQE